MNILTISGSFTAITAFVLMIIFLVYGKTPLHRLWTLVNLAVFVWGIGCFLVGKAATGKEALFAWRIAITGGLLIESFFYHATYIFTGLKKKRILFLVYLQVTIFFLLTVFTKHVLSGWRVLFNSIYYNSPNIIYLSMTLCWWLTVSLSLKEIFLFSRTTKGVKYVQSRYLFIATLIGCIGGGSTLLPAMGFSLYPFGNFGAAIYAIMGTYAILRYRIMDVKVAVTRAGLFVLTYTLVLGLPFAVAAYFKPYLIDSIGPRWYMVPLGLMSVLATVGPFIYIYIDKRAEAVLLREQKRYQDTLKQASMGMVRIRDLRRLLELIAHIVTRTVHINYISIYIHDQATDQYVLHVSRDKGRVPLATLPPDDPLIAWISVKREPLIAEEVRRLHQDTGDETYKKIEESMQKLFASVVIPSYLEDKFIGFICLGDKQSGAIYTADDLNVFQVLASQAALAIENAQFYDEAKEMQEQISQAEKMATIGTMADGLSHQINNRFYALGLIAGDTIDTIKITDTTQCSPEIKTMIAEISKALDRIQVNVTQGGQVVQGMLKYSRRGDEGFEALDVAKILDNTLEMVQFKVKLSDIDIVRNFDTAPKIKGNMTQLEEVFFNFIDNANDAIIERKQTLKESGYRGKISFTCRAKDDATVEIIVEDNGIGVKEEDAKKIFTPFFTTKTSAHVANKKGTGLGLYVIRRIINDMHHGKISFESAYRTGTRFILQLPAAK